MMKWELFGRGVEGSGRLTSKESQRYNSIKQSLKLTEG
jgi:hypothetical protein